MRDGAAWIVPMVVIMWVMFFLGMAAGYFMKQEELKSPHAIAAPATTKDTAPKSGGRE